MAKKRLTQLLGPCFSVPSGEASPFVGSRVNLFLSLSRGVAGWNASEILLFSFKGLIDYYAIYSL